MIPNFLLAFFIGRLKQKSVYATAIINLIPLLGVLFWHWSALEIFLSYIIECGVIAFYSAVMLLLLNKDHYLMRRTWLFKLWFIPVYLVFFAGFLLGFGFTIYYVFPKEYLVMDMLAKTAGALMLGHGLMFIMKFKINQNFYFDYFIQEPTIRMFYIFFVIILGTWANNLFHSHWGFLLALITLKLLLDVGYYGRPLVDARLFEKKSRQ
jgi:hypothetical protein